MTALLIPLDSSSSSPWHFFGYFLDNTQQGPRLALGHTWLSVVPVVVGLLLALPLGWLARRYQWAYPPMMSMTGLLYTIPSIALFVLVPPILGLDPLSPLQVPIALTLYSLALLVRVVADGLGAVPQETAQAATALGYKPLRRFFRVELPIAVPVIAAGLRVAVVANVSIVDGRRDHRVQQPRPALRRGLQAVHGHAVLPADRARHHAVRAARARRSTGWCCSVSRMLTPWRRAVRT